MAIEGDWPDAYRVNRFVRGACWSGSGAGRGPPASRLERAIGVIYRPDTERQSHYFSAQLPAQFDAVIHIDRTSAVEPLEPGAPWTQPEAPETYPFGV